MSEFSIRTKPFRLGLADYRALWLAEFGRAFTVPQLALAILYGLAVVPLTWTLSDLLDGDIEPYLGFQAAWLAVFAGLMALICVALWRRDRRDPVMTGERLMVFDDGAVRLVAPGYDVRQSWAGFSQVRQGRHHIFLYMRGQQAYIIPKSALASPGDAQRLMTAARAAIRAARKTPAALPPLPETPDNRDIWRSHPYRLTFRIVYGRLLQPGGGLVLVVFGLALLAIATYAWQSNLATREDILILFAIPTAIVVFAHLIFVLAWLIVRGRPDMRGLREVCFTRDYVRCTGPAFDVRVDWDNIRGVHHAAGIFAFRFRTGRFDVPAQAFAAPAEATAFFTQAVAFWRAAEARR